MDVDKKIPINSRSYIRICGPNNQYGTAIPGWYTVGIMVKHLRRSWWGLGKLKVIWELHYRTMYNPNEDDIEETIRIVKNMPNRKRHDRAVKRLHQEKIMNL